VLSRRTRIAIEYPNRGLAVAEEVATLIAGPLDWDGPARQAAVDAYRELAQTELAALEAPDDDSAMARLTTATT